MRKLKFTRLVCLVLAFMFLVSTAVVTVGASGKDNTTDKSLKDYGEELKTIKYEKYKTDNKEYFADPNSTVTAVFDAVASDWVFTHEDGSVIEELADGKWSRTVSVVNEDGDKVDETVEYDTLDALLEVLNADKGEHEKKLTKYDFAFVDTFGGEQAIYTPGSGSVTWTLDLAEVGITSAGLYNVELIYYPVAEGYGVDIKDVVKSAGIEREFYINGKTPFAEARAITLAKIWSFVKADASSALTGTIVPGKKENAADILAEAIEAGLTGSIVDGCVVVDRPLEITQKIYNFIDKYTLRFFITDSNNNELRPTQIQTPEWTSYTLRDSGGFYSEALGFVIDPSELADAGMDGKLQIRLEGVNEPMALMGIVLKPYTEAQSYESYLESLEEEMGALEDQKGSGVVKIEAEAPTHTSTNVVYPIEDRTSAVTSPVDTKRILLNTIGTEKWSTAGQWVEYQFTVDGSGMYEILSRYKQSYLDGMYTSRSLQIFTPEYASLAEYEEAKGHKAGYYNGVPFAEAAGLRYDYGTDWQITGLNSGTTDEDFELWFEEGVLYTIRLEVVLGTMSEQIQKIESVLTNLNKDYLSIIKYTGTSPDDYRDYGFSRVLYDTMADMHRQKNNLKEISQFLKDTAGVASSYSGTCDQLVSLLEKFIDDENQIAKNLDNFKAYVGNLGTFLTDAKTQPLQLDYLLIQSSEAKAPKANANFFQSLLHEIKSFIQSFFRDYNSMGASEDAGDLVSIDVWLAYGRDQSQVIRNLSTNDFTPNYNIAVDLKLVAGGTLLPSILAGMGPDVYLGLDDATVINYAIRGALTSVETMEGFDEMVEACFTEAAMIQLEIADADGDVHTYGLPEQQTFEMMFIRTDILYDLLPEIPKTWAEIYTAQSTLASNNMEIGLTTNYKRFLYQANGDLYADDGMRINLDSEEGLNAFQQMCEFFTEHSFPYQYDAANRFRTGEMPIILASYTALYNQLKVFATEIDGKWTFVPIPGTVQADGSINNTADSTITAAVMISDLGEKQEVAAWEFMKWYTGAECQTDYANEMVAIIGDSAKHPTANREALESLPWTRAEYVEVKKQFENLAAIPNYPGSYYIDRHTNFAFLAAYNDGADPTAEILSYINTINKEITRKREEFNLETLEIGQKLSEKRMNQAMNAIENLTEKYADDKYKEAVEMAKYAVANATKNDCVILEDAAALFEAILAADWDQKMITITKVNGNQVEKPSYYVNVGKQTADKDNGGYRIDSLNEQQLVYFIAECLRDAADAFVSYRVE